ncbi:MAG: hypothetical protein KDA71_26025, partial [Planctomycetales bacterium]|nr:hypothetical protein [Planctomycetales bacterium]
VFNTGIASQLVPVTVVPASFVQNQPAPARAGLIVNGGDEATTRNVGPLAGVVADDIFATAHPDFNIAVNGNLPGLAFGLDGLPIGDQLNLLSATSFNIFSDKSAPPNVSILAGNDTFGIVNSSIERIMLTPGNGVINLIGDNNDAAIDQTDNMVVVGRDVNGDQIGQNEMTIAINGSSPIMAQGVNFLNVFGFDLRTTNGGGPIDLTNPDINGFVDNPATGATADDIDTLDIRAYADDTPQGWGVEVNYNEGSPDAIDGDQSDLLIYRTSLYGGNVSEDIVIQPRGQEAGEINVTHAGFGTPIVDINYLNNLDIIVLDDDGSLNDTDSLTLRGTDPANPGASGLDDFIVNLTNAGTIAEPLVDVRDFNANASLYRLRTFYDALGNPTFNKLNIEGLGGSDGLNLIAGRNDGAVTINFDGGQPA